MMKKVKIWSSNRADLEMSHFVRDRDDGKCFFCGKKGSQNSHFWGRNKSATRYESDNCDYVCGGCHMRQEANKQGVYREMKIRQLGQRRYNELRKLFYQNQMTRREAIQKCQKMLSLYEIRKTKNI